MQKKWWTLFNIIFLSILLIILSYIIYNFSLSEEIEEVSSDCVDVNNVASLIYDACYDAYTKQIFVELRRGIDSYDVRKLEVSFFDFSQKNYDLTEVPETNSSIFYKISAEKNPLSFEVSLDIFKDFSAPICPNPRIISVDYCPPGISQDTINSSISPLNGEDLESFISVGTGADDSDVFSLDLVDKERIWASSCESRWDCSSWGPCLGGVQKRECRDLQGCFIPTGIPDSVRYCDGTCEEKWECEWSSCNSGYTTPKCKDLNDCGTEYQIPEKLSCDFTRKCDLDIQCSDWSACELNYNFMDLINGVDSLEGISYRTCIDSNFCVSPTVHSKRCYLGVDIYTKRFKQCGLEYVGIYNKLTGELISRIDLGNLENPHLNIILGKSSDRVYCDYCFDGVKNGDEEEVDCGGSCESCDDKYLRRPYKKKGVLDRIGDWIKRMIT